MVTFPINTKNSILPQRDRSRHYSQFLALQLKARMEGIDTPVYERAASHHTRGLGVVPSPASGRGLG